MGKSLTVKRQRMLSLKQNLKKTTKTVSLKRNDRNIAKTHTPMWRISIVPWMSRNEWDFVRQGLFSTLESDQIIAVRRIAAWKSRCQPRMPLGIEVTAALVRAKLEDASMKHSNEAQLHHDDVIMLYSMSLIRFVNLVTESGQGGKLTKPVHIVAEELGVPEWLVELRHQATHHTIPSLSTVRLGAALALEWIKNHYWKVEEKRIEDLNRKLNETRNVERQLIQDTLSAFRKLTGKKTVSKVGKKFVTTLKNTMHSKSDTVIEEIVQYFLLKPQRLIDSLELEELTEECLVKSIPLVNMLNETNAVPTLLSVLLTRMYEAKSKAQLRGAKWLITFLRFLEKERGLNGLPVNGEWNTVLQIALKHPTQYTPLVFPMVANYVKPALSWDVKNKLTELVNIYCQNDDVKSDSGSATVTYHTLDEIVDTSFTDESCWQRCEDYAKWKEFPLGILPSQVGAEILNLDLPTRVDHLHTHRMENWLKKKSIPPAYRKREKVNDDKEPPLIAEPNLRARLHLVQHRKVAAKWTDAQMAEVVNGLVFL